MIEIMEEYSMYFLLYLTILLAILTSKAMKTLAVKLDKAFSRIGVSIEIWKQKRRVNKKLKRRSR